MAELFLIRHGIAADAAPGQPDEARPLTDEGRRKMEEVARGLAALDVGFDELAHSPLLRAVQTAECLAELLDGETRVEPRLAAAPTAELVRAVRGRRAALVGHEPWTSDLLALLVHGARHPFKKGGVAWLEGELAPGGMRLVAFLPPRVTRRPSPRDRD